MAWNDRIREARQAKGLTQQQVGDYLGVAKSTVAGYERGSSEPDVNKVYRLLTLLEVDANYLYQDEMAKIRSSHQSESEKVLAETSDERQLLISYRQLTDEGKDSIQKLMIMHVNTYKKDEDISDEEGVAETA